MLLLEFRMKILNANAAVEPTNKIQGQTELSFFT